MAPPDILDIHRFYETPRGALCQRIIGERLHHIMGKMPPPQTMVGVGYTLPYINGFSFSQEGKAPHKFLFMSHEEGAMRWPQEGPCQVSLVDLGLWPLPDRSIDVIFLAHTLEYSCNPSSLLREVWRVLKNDGYVVALVPNRRGLWSRAEGTPFGHGHPYARSQLVALFQEGCFAPLKIEGCLYAPPFNSSVFLSTAGVWEKLGKGWCEGASGAFLIQAVKNLYAGIPLGKKTWVRQYAPTPSR
jgi:SAM-dependent methyltransferase